MAISLKTAGTWARMVTDGGTVAIPGTPAAGDRMFLFGSWKTFSVTVATPNGWNLIDDFSDGSVAAGNGSGSVHNAVYYRDWQSGDAAPAIDYSAAPTEGHWVIQLWTKAGGDLWDTPVGVHAAIAAADPFTATSSATVTVPDSSVVMCLIGLSDDSTTIARTASTAIEDDGSPNVTWNGDYVESPATHFNSTTGLDMSGDLGHRFVTTGAAGVNLTTTGDPAAAETGTATWIVQGLGVNPAGTGAITVPSATVAGTGTEVFTATGAVSVPSATVAGTGAEVFTATGSVTVPSATVAGTGTEVFTATGAVSVPAATVAGTGNHEAAQQDPEGTGAVSVPAATVSGSGALVLTGSGAVSVPAPTVAGSGTEVLTATGAISGAAPTVAGSGLMAEAAAGTGAVTVPAPAVVGAGLHIQNATGTGAITVPAATVSGVGSGAAEAPIPDVIVVTVSAVRGPSAIVSGGPSATVTSGRPRGRVTPIGEDAEVNPG